MPQTYFFQYYSQYLYSSTKKNDGFKSFGMCCRILGVVVINLANGGFDMSIKLSGEGAILLSAAAYALSSGMIKKYSKDENPVVLSGYQFF